MVPSHKVQSLRYIAVVRNNYRAVICIQPAVIQQMHGEVYIRTLFLCPEYFHLLSPQIGRTSGAQTLCVRKPP